MFNSNAAAKVERIAACALAAALTLLAGCASSKLAAEWTDPQFKGRSLRGTKVFVVCEAAEPAIKLNCEQQMASEMTAVGATPVRPEPTDATLQKQPQGAEQYLAAARAAGAGTVLNSAIAPDATVVNPGPSIGFGFGGFRTGGGGGGVGTSVGMSAPVGSGQVMTGYAANSTLTDVATGLLMWTAKATSPPSKDVNEQMAKLAKAVADGAQKAGFF
jgi:hypothetical protein